MSKSLRPSAASERSDQASDRASAGPPTGQVDEVSSVGPRRLALPRATLLRHPLLAAAAGLLLFLLTESTDEFTDTRISSVAYSFVVVAGLTVLVGWNGQISLGHGALMAIGAYTFALLTLHQPGWPFWLDLIASLVVTAVAGAPVGFAAARLRGPYLAGATLALAVGLPALASKYTSVFGGNNGLLFETTSPPAGLGVDFPLERWQAWICCLAALVTVVLLANLARSRVGRNFRAVRDDEVAAALAGINVARTQVVAFVVSAGCAGLAGGLLALTLGTAAPGSFQFSLSVSLLAVAVLGGLGSLAGALWGSLVLVYLPAWSDDLAGRFSLSTNVQNNLPLAVYGAVLIIVMLLFPRGIQGGLRRLTGAGSHLLVRRTVPELPSAPTDGQRTQL
ncbi:MAG TPA: branched-chain amino acid ABC transporter permease [Mycobacteriales bacterium]|nr:branched-chain amino acid ABC transporter permease [Mycobacteriales bacterium]